MKIYFEIIQGSPLAFVILCIWANNIGKLNLQQANLFFYADDTVIIFEGNSCEEGNAGVKQGLILSNIGLTKIGSH